MTIELTIPNEANVFLSRKKNEQIIFLANLEAKDINNLTKLAKCNIPDETMHKLIELARSPKASALLKDNWSFIKNMM